MAIYKVAKCKCGYKKNDPTGKGKVSCPKCNATIPLSENWSISYQINGKKYTEAVSPSRRTAEDALAKKRVDIREDRFFDKVSDLTWQEAVKHFRAWFQVNVKPKTKLMYENSLAILGKHLDRHTLNKITPQMLEKFKQDRMLTVTNSTINRDLATLKRMYSLCVEWKLLEVNRIASVKLLKENSSRVRHLTDEEVAALLSKIKLKWLSLAVKIALYTGLRKEAITSLKWSNIDFNGRIVSNLTKGDKVAKVPLIPSLYDAIVEYKAGQKIMSQFVFPSPGDPRRPIRMDNHGSFDRACDNAGIKDFRFHDLRHTFASNFYKRTRDWKALQEILGHASISMTMKIYTHLDQAHIEDAMQKFGGAL